MLILIPPLEDFTVNFNECASRMMNSDQYSAKDFEGDMNEWNSAPETNETGK